VPNADVSAVSIVRGKEMLSHDVEMSTSDPPELSILKTVFLP
jgi:hypothetical protein